MTWLRVDDRFPRHRKVRRLSDRAFRVHVTAMAACAEDETDGLVTGDDLADLVGVAQRYVTDAVVELVAAGLWDVVEEGRVWQVHDYLDYNPSHASLVADREANRRRQAKHRRKPSGPPPDPGNGVSHGVTDGVTNGVSHAAPSRPVPTRPVVGTPSPSSSTEPEHVGRAIADLALVRRIREGRG